MTIPTVLLPGANRKLATTVTVAAPASPTIRFQMARVNDLAFSGGPAAGPSAATPC
jgi:hypothetical protein